MEVRDIKKLYYSIGQVSEITQLKPYVLRYWETEFSHLKPSKNSAGNRTYTSEDIDNIKEIKRLLHEERFTIKGARQHLKDLKANPSKVVNINSAQNIDVSLLKKIQSDIDDLLLLVKDLKKDI
tara:strand:- start:184 stop:555 length:372 start_codon:yes stop_codon:yes gene_type:complete